MDIGRIIKEKPYLKDSLRLYEKVLEFTEAVLNLSLGIPFADASYPPALVDRIFEVFSDTFEIPGENIFSLKEAMKSGRFDLTRLSANEIPFFSLPYHEDELGMILFLIGKPFFVRRGGSQNGNHGFWERGSCPVCNAKPAIASVDAEGKKLYCPYCGATGLYRRSGCPFCSTDRSGGINIFFAEGDPGFRIEACDSCGSYLKTVKADTMEELTPDLADIISTPLDIVAQGKGYKRSARNPVGLIRMI